MANPVAVDEKISGEDSNCGTQSLALLARSKLRKNSKCHQSPEKYHTCRVSRCGCVASASSQSHSHGLQTRRRRLSTTELAMDQFQDLSPSRAACGRRRFSLGSLDMSLDRSPVQGNFLTQATEGSGQANPSQLRNRAVPRALDAETPILGAASVAATFWDVDAETPLSAALLKSQNLLDELSTLNLDAGDGAQDVEEDAGMRDCRIRAINSIGAASVETVERTRSSDEEREEDEVVAVPLGLLTDMMSNFWRESGQSSEKSETRVVDVASTVPSLCGSCKALTSSIPSSKASTASQHCPSSASTVLSSQGDASDDDVVRMRRALWKLLHSGTGDTREGTKTNDVRDQENIDRAFLIKMLRALEKENIDRAFLIKILTGIEKESDAAPTDPLASEKITLDVASLPTSTSCGSMASPLTSPSMQSIGSVQTMAHQQNVPRGAYTAYRPSPIIAFDQTPRSWSLRQHSQGCLSPMPASPCASLRFVMSPRPALDSTRGLRSDPLSAHTAAVAAATTASAVAAATSSAFAAASATPVMQQLQGRQVAPPAAPHLTTVSTTAITTVSTGGTVATATTCVTTVTTHR